MNNWIFVAFWIAALADAWTTRIGIGVGLKEANPFFRFILNKLPGDSEPEYFFVKVLAFGLFSIAEPPMWAWITIIVLQLVVAGSNYRLYRKRKLG